MNVTQVFRHQLKQYLMLGAISAGLLVPSVAHANLSTGTFNAIGNASISFASISFSTNPVFSVGTGDFVAINGTSGTIKNITNPPYSVNTVFPTPNFLTFNALPGISFTLTELFAGTFGTAGCGSGGPCSPPNTPYNLFNQGGNAVASFSVAGFETDGTNTTPFQATFSSTFAGQTYQSIVNAVNNGQTVNTTYSASFFVEATPEPALLLIPLAIGFMVMLGFQRRAAQNRS